METRKTILIFGISSFVGSALAEVFRDKYKVVGTYHKTKVEIPGITIVNCDVLQKDLVQRLVRTYRPDITLYAVGITDLMVCQEFPKLADAVNTAGVFNVSAASERYQSKFIYLSSSFVFSGEDVEFKESDNPTPLNVYGNTKASAEFFIQKSCLNYLIFRCAPIFGHGINKNDPKFIEILEREEFHGRKIPCDNVIETGFLDIFSLASVIDKAIDQKITNKLLQVSSTEIMTHFEFAKLYFSKSRRDESLISQGDWDFPLSRASSNGGDGSLKFRLNTTNLYTELGIKLPNIEGMIEVYLSKMGK